MNGNNQLTTLKGDAVASYTYDEDGLRLTKTVGDTTHEYFYNDEVLDMEVVKKNSEVTQYRYYEWNGYTPLGMIVKEKDATGNFQTKAYQYITNHRGDVLSIRDQDDQEVGSYSYDAYGNVLSVEGDVAKDNPIRYAGYYYDEETKNYYLQTRYYNPENGSFLALDPHPGDDDEPLSQNGYTYANNNPVMNVDPDGQKALSWNRFKKSIRYGFKLWLSQYVGWDNAETVIALIPVYVDKITKSVKAIYSHSKKQKSLRKGIEKAFKKSVIKSRSFRNSLKRAMKREAKKVGRKALAKALVKANLGWTDVAIFAGGTSYAYAWKYRKVK